MSEWTELQALDILATGDCLRVTHPNFLGEELQVRKVENGYFVAYRETEFGEDDGDPLTEETGIPVMLVGDPDLDPEVGRWLWGEFTVVGFDMLGEARDEATAEANRREFAKALEHRMN